MIKIRKGAQVRVRRTHEIATISDIELIRKNGGVHKYCHLVVAKDKSQKWLDSSELTDIKETVQIDLTSSDGYKISAEFVYDFKQNAEHTLIIKNASQLRRAIEDNSVAAAFLKEILRDFDFKKGAARISPHA